MEDVQLKMPTFSPALSFNGTTKRAHKFHNHFSNILFWNSLARNWILLFFIGIFFIKENFTVVV